MNVKRICGFLLCGLVSQATLIGQTETDLDPASNLGAQQTAPTVQPATRDIAVPLRPTPKPQIVAPRRRPVGIKTDTTLTWDAIKKEIHPPRGTEKGELYFQVANDTEADVTITSIKPSCGCTLAKSPTLPWTLKPGDGDKIHLSISLRGKTGVLRKSVTVMSSVGRKILTFAVHIPTTEGLTPKMAMSERLKNMQMAAADRQIIFKKAECRTCHFDDSIGKHGEELYQAACGVCHDTPHRATMVPDLTVAKAGIERNDAYWKFWIANGKEGSLMPAFNQKAGGPLTEDQIDKLAKYLTQRFAGEPVKKVSAVK